MLYSTYPASSHDAGPLSTEPDNELVNHAHQMRLSVNALYRHHHHRPSTIIHTPVANCNYICPVRVLCFYNSDVHTVFLFLFVLFSVVLLDLIVKRYFWSCFVPLACLSFRSQEDSGFLVLIAGRGQSRSHIWAPRDLG